MKRKKYFKYLDVQIYDAHNEDAKKHFRITNRFIDEGRKVGKYLFRVFKVKVERLRSFLLT